ncbi:Mitochondrial import inner membrane translocase subunit tim22 [Bonamia ostreae]|uniref:Mitochondrial import inner membrane translocase subunit TIM22 n=1 Tax=Bonamia ostreae TaxID=126728 RepID=A0ABV2AL58_9EUKA
MDWSKMFKPEPKLGISYLPVKTQLRQQIFFETRGITLYWPYLYNPMETIPVKAITGLFIGGITGIVFGIFMSAFTTAPFDYSDKFNKLPFKEQMKISWKSNAKRSVAMGKSFSIVMALYNSSLTFLSRRTAREDIWAKTKAGFVTGSLFNIRRGAFKMALGGTGFAIFNYLFEKYLETK